MSQTAEILARLEAGETITPLDALREVGSFRLGARIWELKRAGHDIEAIRVQVAGGAVVAGYRLRKPGIPVKWEGGQGVFA